MASSSSRGHNKSYKYNVFLSFRGEDTRKNFVDHLYAALDRQGIYTFKDDERLERGKEINEGLLRAIEDSRFYIIVFSERYASSSWCLNELLKIMECHKTNGHTAFPVFYDVDPSEVRKQTGSVGEALSTHKNESEVGKWREALKEAAGLSGLDVRNTANGHEAKVIEMIVEWVSLELRPFDIHVDENLIGMKQRMLGLHRYLKMGLKDVRMVGIKGMGGAGKTTLARALFNEISINFEGKSFVENVRENSKSPLGLKMLQEQILRDVLKDKNITVSGVLEGVNLMRNRLRGKEILLVLDDVDHREQLEMLVGDPSWFKPGSRVIITTRDGEVLEEHNVKWIHDINLLTEEEAICLFSRHAFGKDIPTQGYEKHSHEAVSYAAGLPLTVKVLGSKLCGKDDRQWRYTLERLKTIPLKETLKKLELSYESLEDEHKELFLHVACFLRRWQKDSAICMLESCGLHAKYGLRVLEQKSLISLKDKFRIQMHDHMEELGKNIVRREYPKYPDRYNRLWVQEEIEKVLANDLGTEATRFIKLKITPDVVLEGLGNMKKLICLIVKGYDRNCVFDEALQYFPNSLQYIQWNGYPHWCLPRTFEANNLVALKMSGTIIKHLWEGGKVMKKLRFLDLNHSRLRSLDLGLTPNLERLDLAYCKYLAKPKVRGGCLKCLVYLNLEGCKNLKSVSFIKEMESLEVLNLGHLDLREFPDNIFTGHLTNSLLELNLSGNKDIEEIPSSIGNLHKLVSLDLSSCYRLKSLTGSICSLQHLTTLNLSWSGIEELPEDLGQLECLEYLNLGFTKVQHLPGSICKLKRLKTLILFCCRLLEKLPEDVGELESLERLDLTECAYIRDIPSSICKLKHLKELELVRCIRLEKLPDELGNLECLQSLSISNTGITHLPKSLSLLKGLKTDMFLQDHLYDYDFIKICYKPNFQIQGFQQLITLDLGRCRIKEVPEFLGQLECLRELDLSYTNVKHLPNSICMLKHLKKLVLKNCARLEMLPDDVGQLESLEVLDLYRCYGVRELPNSISMLTQLKFLVLHHCICLENIPDDVGQLESLEVLDLSRCFSIREIPSSICMLKHLKMLHLEGCVGIEELPEALGQLECLEELNISYTDVKRLSDSICMLKHLKKLVLQHCVLLEMLPDDVGQLESLEVLDLSRCYSIREIPNSISMLTHLKFFDLSHCFCLEKVPDDVGQLESLEVLDLSRCYNIREIPSSIYMLKHLKRLNLENCRMLEKQSHQQPDLECSQSSYTWDVSTSINGGFFGRSAYSSYRNCWDYGITHLGHLSLEKLREDVRQLECLVEFYLSCGMKDYAGIYEPRPNDVGDLRLLPLLDIQDICIRRPPQSIYLLKFLKMYGFTPAIHTSSLNRQFGW